MEMPRVFQPEMQMHLVKGSKWLQPHKYSHILICAAQRFTHIYAHQGRFMDYLKPPTIEPCFCVF